jgi:hypothetical protein
MLDGPLVARFDLKGNKDLALALAEKNALRQELSDSFELSWLEDRVKPDSGLWGNEFEHVAHFALETVLWISVGMAFSAFLKPFAESVASEAGKDFWSGLKRLAGRIWKTQAKDRYRYKNTTNVVFNDSRNPIIVVQFSSPFIEGKVEGTNGLLETRLDAMFTSLSVNLLSLEGCINDELGLSVQGNAERQPVVLVHLSQKGPQVARLISLADIGGKDIFVVAAQNPAARADG